MEQVDIFNCPPVNFYYALGVKIRWSSFSKVKAKIMLILPGSRDMLDFAPEGC